MTTTVNQNGNQLVVVEALPYIDTEYEEPGMKEMVMAMIEEEKKRYRPTKNYLQHLPPLEMTRFETDVMKKEFERLLQRQPMETLSMKRYELPPPPAGKLTDVSAWNECVENSCAQLEHQATRICNLELMLDFNCESWKSYLDVLVRMVSQCQKQLADVKRKIQEVNWQRKSNQTNAGDQLKLLESSWVGLVSKNYEIERACLELEARIIETKTELARRDAMAVDHEPLENLTSRQHPQYIPEVPKQKRKLPPPPPPPPAVVAPLPPPPPSAAVALPPPPPPVDIAPPPPPPSDIYPPPPPPSFIAVAPSVEYPRISETPEIDDSNAMDGITTTTTSTAEDDEHDQDDNIHDRFQQEDNEEDPPARGSGGRNINNSNGNIEFEEEQQHIGPQPYFPDADKVDHDPMDQDEESSDSDSSSSDDSK